MSALELTLRAAAAARAREITELCINRPGEAFVETRAGWRREPLPFADFDWCRRLAKLVANSTRQRIDERRRCCRPRCRAASGSRSCCRRRRPRLRRDHDPPAVGSGLVDRVNWRQRDLPLDHRARATRSMRPRRELLQLLEAQDYEAFMRLAVASRKNILVSGPTGSGKTTWTKALIREIPARNA